ncbi:MAG: hypothetical protein KatS3mg076_0281 [Candidatus Binatia bacterium]|nr:MAG: hypothetical protein KatS3mg076_0281 [Candidatus Binatia bacterium]
MSRFGRFANLSVWAIAAAAFAASLGSPKTAVGEPTRTFTVVSIEVEGTKFWIPSTLIVEKGDRVRITLLNKVPSDPNQHGFAIPDYGIAEVVTRGESKTVEFVADKAGVFPITCHLHPAHIGGQLLVR